MRRVGLALALLLSCVVTGQTAHAADMRTKPVYKAPPKAAPFSWTGLYAGAHVGGGWNRNSWFDTGVNTSIGSNTASGWLAGGQIGYNYQVGSWVLGVEGDAAWADLTGNHRDPVFSLIAPTGLETHHVTTDFLATLAARAGFVWNRSLLYVKGGAAWGHNKYHTTDFFAIGQTLATAERTRSGWTVGAGWEYAISDRVSAKFEYNYIDLGTDRVRMACLAIPGCVSFTVDITQQIHIAKFGLNYRFASSW